MVYKFFDLYIYVCVCVCNYFAVIRIWEKLCFIGKKNDNTLQTKNLIGTKSS